MAASGSRGATALAVRGVWLALALPFLGIGLQKLTAYEAQAVAPLAASSPFLAWLYDLLGVRGASFAFAAVEIPTGLGLIVGVVRPTSWPARIAAPLAAATAFVTLSFVATAPGAWIVRDGVPLLTVEVGQLFAKDLVLLAAALLLTVQAWSPGRR